MLAAPRHRFAPPPARLPPPLLPLALLPLTVLPLTVLLLTGLAGCGGRQEAPHVLLISIDTLRADRLGCYGYPRPTTAAVDRFRQDAALFRQAIAQAPSTLASHASLFTSLLPRHHGASMGRETALPDDALTLAEVLRQHGYATAGFHNSGQMRPEFGLGRGFDLYERVPRHRFGRVVERALAWLDGLEGLDGRPFFLFLHTYEVHHPYTPRKWRLEALGGSYDGPLPDRISVELLERINRGEVEIDDAGRAHIAAAYDAEIQSMDFAFGHLIEELKRRRLYDRTLIVFTSDHGEELGEHGTMGWHSHTLYDELLRVPLLIKPPAGATARAAAGADLGDQVRLLDLAPTVLEILGLPPPSEFAGRSLLPLLAGGSAAPHPAVSERDLAEGYDAAVRARRWKLWGGRLFDLEADPGELRDVAAERPRVRQALERVLQGELEGRAAARGEATRLSEEAEAELRALGYLR